MPKNSQLNIRFDDVTDQQLEVTAGKLGVSKSALIRHLTKTFLEEVERSGTLALQPDWKRMLGAADARSGWGERKTQLPLVADEEARGKNDEKPPSSVKYPVKKSARRKSV